MLHISRHPSFISIQFLVLNLDGWFAVSSNKLLLFDIPLLYYFILRSLLIYFPFSREIYISPSTPSTFVAVSELPCGKVIGIFVISSTILFQIKSPVASAVYLNCSFWSTFEWNRRKLFSMINKFPVLFTIYLFTYILTIVSTQIFSKRQKVSAFEKYLSAELNPSSFFICYNFINN